MKRILAILLSVILLMTLSSCGLITSLIGSGSSEAETDPEPAVNTEINAKEATGAFSITTEDGAFTEDGNVYTVTAAGTYVLSGYLEGQVIVDSGETGEVVLELSGVTVTSGEDSPIKILSASDVDVSAKKDTENLIKDTRSAKTAENDDQGEGAIYAKTDLKIKGSGTLVVEAGYNNGIHTTKDLTIQKVTLKVTARNNALKGNDSITVTSGTVAAISTNGDGVKTENTDVNKNGVTRGDILLTGGSVTVYAAGDGFQSARDFVMQAGETETPSVTIYTGSYSGYTASDASVTSYKGVKVQNELLISAGEITIQSFDDGLHADQGTSLLNGTKGKGNILISGGTVTMNVYAPETKTAMGRSGPGGQGRPGGPGGGFQPQTVAGADAIHADGVLTVSGGTIRIDSAYEGLEANVINITGGETVVAANDDGVNACKGTSTPAVNVTGGLLDVTVSPNGDTDGIDSNGTYLQTGGVVITRGPSSQMAAALDADGSVTVSGGTLIVLGYGRVSTSGSVRTQSLSLNSQGSHTVKIDGTTYSFTNAYSYGTTTCYSDQTVSQ